MLTNYKLNKELDKEMALEFLNISAGGVDFSFGITSIHPELKNIKSLDEQDQKNKIDEYFDKFYQEKFDFLNGKTVEFSKSWSKTEHYFFEKALKIFKHKIEPKNYNGYISIINCNPRFVHENSFQVYWEHPSGSVYVTSHEILHFLFFDYIKKVFPDSLGKLDPDSSPLWELSEIFNDIVLSLPEFVIIHGQNELKHYPDLEKYLLYAKSKWETLNLDDWIKDMIKKLE